VKYLLALLPLLIWGCAAPHDNPLDPKSDHYVAPQPEPEPVVFGTQIYSVHLARFGFSDSYSVIAHLSETASTPEVDSAWVTYDGRDRVRMTAQPPTYDLWATQFAASYFHDSLDAVIGRSFIFEVRDAADSTYVLDPVYLYRFIEEVPLVIEPDSQDVVTPYVVLKWQRAAAGYPYQCRAAITSNLTGIELWASDLMSSTADSAVVTDSLANGDYFWTVTIIDDFANTSRSKEGFFTVTANP
jgi:hypothetical protein